MNKRSLPVLATMVIAWLVSSINATPPQRRQPETPPTNLALEVTYHSEGYRPNSPQVQEIVITAAMFEDNSYEGDAKTAALFRAFMIGRKIQAARLIPLVQTGADSTELNVSAAVNKLKTQVSSLSTEAETSEVDRLLKDFPTLSTDVKESLKKGIEVALHGVKVDLLRDLHKFEKPASQSLGAQAFQTWLRVNKEKFEKWLSIL